LKLNFFENYFETGSNNLTLKAVVFFLIFAVLSISLSYHYLIIRQIDISSTDILKTSILNFNDLIKTDSLKTALYRDKLYSLLEKSNYRIIVTDSDNRPLWWNNIGENEKSFTPYSKKILQDIDSRGNLPIKLEFDKPLYVHYAQSGILENISLFPVIQLVILLTIILVILFAFKAVKQNEKKSIWIAMSKETAHQLGTPLTSLSGWRDYLTELARSSLTKGKESITFQNQDNVDHDDSIRLQEISQVANGISEDLKRIDLVIARFSQISSTPEKKICNLNNVVKEITDYLSSRIPIKKENKIDINFEKKQEIDLFMNPILMSWVVENILKNSIQAIPKKISKGKIEIDLFSKGDKVFLDISDNGKGISHGLKSKIFEVGYTTKTRGWGLGLSLAKRVIEEYHNGKIFIRESAPDKGTTIRIVLNKYV